MVIPSESNTHSQAGPNDPFTEWVHGWAKPFVETGALSGLAEQVHNRGLDLRAWSQRLALAHAIQFIELAGPTWKAGGQATPRRWYLHPSKGFVSAEVAPTIEDVMRGDGSVNWLLISPSQNLVVSAFAGPEVILAIGPTELLRALEPADPQGMLADLMVFFDDSYSASEKKFVAAVAGELSESLSVYAPLSELGPVDLPPELSSLNESNLIPCSTELGDSRADWVVGVAPWSGDPLDSARMTSAAREFLSMPIAWTAFELKGQGVARCASVSESFELNRACRQFSVGCAVDPQISFLFVWGPDYHAVFGPRALVEHVLGANLKALAECHKAFNSSCPATRELFSLMFAQNS